MYSKLWATADGIYPKLERLVKPLVSEENIRYAAWQEATRKDIKRCFGVLQRKFASLAKPVELWYIEEYSNVVYACIIMHNMMVETWVQQGEEEDPDHYALHFADDAPPVDTAMEYEEQLDAEQNIQERILQANALDDAALQYQWNRYYLLHLRCVQHQWQDQYKSDKHF